MRICASSFLQGCLIFKEVMRSLSQAVLRTPGNFEVFPHRDAQAPRNFLGSVVRPVSQGYILEPVLWITVSNKLSLFLSPSLSLYLSLTHSLSAPLVNTGQETLMLFMVVNP